MSQPVHIVTFDIPYPPDYGGVVDVFYRIQALSSLGCEVHLHCFHKRGMAQQPIFEKMCKSVHYYSRKPIARVIRSAFPAVIASRSDEQLLKNLKKDNFPILFEGVHTSMLLRHPGLRERWKGVRLHNVEWQYYRHLANASANWAKRLYFARESRLLKRYEENKLGGADQLFCISAADREWFAERYTGKVNLVNGFHAFKSIAVKEGKGEYILLHGDLGVEENEQVVRTLVQNVLSKLEYRVIVAGKRPRAELVNYLSKYANIDLRPDVRSEEMESLMVNAQLHIVHALQTSGFKIKLLHALFTGRFVAVNQSLADKSGVSGAVEAYSSFEELKRIIDRTMPGTFDQASLVKREEFLDPAFNNLENARRILATIP